MVSRSCLALSLLGLLSSVQQSAAVDACVTDPTAAACSTYVYSEANAAADVASLCKMMPYMSICTMKNACDASTAEKRYLPEASCSSFYLLATSCKYDTEMKSMMGCSSYNKLCATGSVVKQCTDVPGDTTFISTKIANDQLKAGCNMMTMDGCEKCTPDWTAGKTYATCDLLGIYSSQCFEMPNMSNCAAWKSMCAAEPQKSSYFLCTGDDVTTGTATDDGAGTTTTHNHADHDHTSSAKGVAGLAMVVCVGVLAFLF